MVNECFKRQMPECFDRPEVSEPPVPGELRYGREEYVPAKPMIPEEPMGNGEMVPVETIAYA